MLSRLDTILSSMGYIDDNAQYEYLVDEANDKGLSDQFTVAPKTFARWKDKLSSHQPVSKNKGMRSSWNFLSTLLGELESGATSKMEELTEVVKDIGTDDAQDSEALVDSAIIQTVVQEGVRPEENTGDMYLELNRWRKEWGIIAKPEESFVPKRIKKMIDTFCLKCVEDVEFGNEWARCSGEGMPVIQISDAEASGCTYSGHPIIEYTDSRKFIGYNTSKVRRQVGITDTVDPLC